MTTAVKACISLKLLEISYIYPKSATFKELKDDNQYRFFLKIDWFYGFIYKITL